MIVKMLRQKFDHQWAPRRPEPGAGEQAAILQLIKPALLHAEATLDGPTISGSDLTRLAPGDLVLFDSRVERPMSLLINDRTKYHGHVGTIGRKRVFVVDEIDRE